MMVQIVNIVLVYICVNIYCTHSLIWKESKPLPQALACQAIAINQYRNESYLFLNNRNYGYTFNGSNYVKRTSQIIVSQSNYLSATSISNLVYIQASFKPSGYYSEVIIFNTLTNKWIPDPILMPTQLKYWDGSCVTNNGTHLFSIGGMINNDPINHTYPPYDVLYIYNIIHHQWRKGPTYNYSLNRISCGYYKDTVYMFGGSTPSENSILKYNTNNNELILSKAVLTTSKFNTAAIMPNHDGIFYIIGGYGKNVLTDVDIFDANNENVSPGTPLLKGRDCSMVTFMNAELYVSGGYNQSGNWPMTSVEVSNVIPTESPTKSPTPYPTKFTTPSPTTMQHDIIYQQWRLLVIIGSSVMFMLILCCGCLFYRKRRRNDQVEGEGEAGNMVVDITN